ncbi:unnamed protein product [Schistocephalus solidus]|uniref:G_PROTEIN_RECEP_F1_2 domain-containing protein n=1 Tax=Schistocephalus solidus TaxID=70667 RepID=A0A183TLX2_SCHSO|nr:unnamed protein product [Schistocephalus solidus]
MTEAAPKLAEADRIVQIFEDVFLTYLAGVAMITGIITSLLSLLIFRRDSQTSKSTRLLLSMVAFSDFNLLVSAFFFYLVREAIPKGQPGRAFFEHPIVFSLLFYISNVFELFRNWLLVVISFERLLFFLKPIEFKTVWRLRTVKSVIAGLIFFSLLARLPGVVYAFTENLRSRPLRVHRLSKLLHTSTDCILLTSLPITLMTLICIVTTRRMRRVMRIKLRLMKGGSELSQMTATLGETTNPNEAKSKTQRKPNRIIKIIHVVLTVFISFSLPSIPASSLQFYVVYHNVRNSALLWTLQIFRAISNFTSMLNSTANFFVYIFQSRRYRSILAQLLCLDKIYPSLKHESTVTHISHR